jgi:hypothetical protein
MLPLLAGAGGAILGGVKGLLDLGAEGRQRKLQAKTTLWSPWTGMEAKAPERANILGDILSGGLTGFMMGQANPAAASPMKGTVSNLWGMMPGARKAPTAIDYEQMYA